MGQFTICLLAFILPVARSVDVQSTCYLGPGGFTKNSVGTYETKYMEPLDLQNMKTGDFLNPRFDLNLFLCKGQDYAFHSQDLVT